MTNPVSASVTTSFYDQLNGRKYGTHQITCTGLKPLTLHTLLVEGATYTGQMFQAGKAITANNLITDASGKIQFNISIQAVYYKTYKFEMTAPYSYCSGTTVATWNTSGNNNRSGEVFVQSRGGGHS